MATSVVLSVKRYECTELIKGKRHDILISIQDLIEANGITDNLDSWKIPLTANVRRPVENRIVKDIVKSLISIEGYSIDAPIHLAGDCIRFEDGLIRVMFSTAVTSGILDGGHRMLSFMLAYRRCAKDFLKNSFVRLVVYSGLSEQELKEKAIALNTTNAVNASTLAHYAGEYDFLKDVLREYDVIYFEGQRGKHSSPTDGCCTITRIISILLLLDSNFHPSIYDDSKKHPMYAVISGTLIDRKGAKDLINNLKHLIHAAIQLQTDIALEAQKRKKRSSNYMPFMTTAKNKDKATRLPTGEVMDFVMNKPSFINPILSAFRALIDKETLTWKNDIFSDRSKRLALIRKMLTRYCELAQLKKYKQMTFTQISRDGAIWSEMFGIAERFATESSEDDNNGELF